jgi:mevalonate kinase
MGHGAGKVILFGEHAVVYGKPALAASLSRGARAEASAIDPGSLHVAPWNTRVTLVGDEPVDEKASMLRCGFRTLLAGYPDAARRLGLRAEMEIPGGAGLGGSAALSVAVIRALDAALGLTRSDTEVAELSLSWERVFHGNPSGVDSAMAASAGVAEYVKGKPLRPVTLARPLYLSIAHSGEYGSTKTTVESVARQHTQDPVRVNKVLDGIEAVVVNARRAIEDGELRKLGQLMELNQQLLVSLLLSTPRLEELCRAAKAAGALGAKLTGGGGGGCMIALSETEAGAEQVRQALTAFDAAAFVVEVRG